MQADARIDGMKNGEEINFCSDYYLRGTNTGDYRKIQLRAYFRYLSASVVESHLSQCACFPNVFNAFHFISCDYFLMESSTNLSLFLYLTLSQFSPLSII